VIDSRLRGGWVVPPFVHLRPSDEKRTPVKGFLNVPIGFQQLPEYHCAVGVAFISVVCMMVSELQQRTKKNSPLYMKPDNNTNAFQFSLRFFLNNVRKILKK
jgi:hypothetical protein